MDANRELWALACGLFHAAEKQDDGTYLVRIGESGMAAITRLAFAEELGDGHRGTTSPPHL